MEPPQKETHDVLSFPFLVGIFVYFSAVTVAMAIYWQTGIWYQNPGLTKIGTILAVVLVASIIIFAGVFLTRRKRISKQFSPPPA